MEELDSWNRFQVGHFWLHVHPDLEVTVVKESTKTLILLGYLFDPEDFRLSNEEIVRRITALVKDFNGIVLALKQYAGRYVLLYEDSESLNLIQDALSLREVYYCQSDNLVVCGSQPNLLLRFSRPPIRESRDRELLDFVQNHLPRVRNGRLWPGEGTPYEAIKHLLPNHYLDLTRLESRRYWPNVPLAGLGIEVAVHKCAAFLQGILKAAAHRNPLMLAVTSGEDSRALLAACREILNSVYFFINKHDRLSDRSADIRVPKEIFRRIEIPFNVHQYPKDVPEEFKRIFFENCFFAHEMLLPVIYNVYHMEHCNRVNILGVGEVGRTKFFNDPQTLTPYYLAYMLRYRKSSYAVRQCESWLAEAEPVARRYGLNIMTLFWWEVLIGNWGAVGNSESDIAIEEFDPYNSHLLYETFLSVDAKYRTFRGNKLFTKLIAVMWPDLLDVPFNPPESAKDWCIYTLSKLRIEDSLRMLKFRLYESVYRYGGKPKNIISK